MSRTTATAHPWTVAVLGPGGVGGLLAALLSRAGHRVICLAGEETARVLREDGIQVRSGVFGDFHAAVEADTALREPVDLCLVTVKHTALDAASERVPPRMLTGPRGGGLVLPLLNGFAHTDVLRRRYGAERVVPAAVTVESTRTAPGIVEHSSPFVKLALAEPSEGPADGLGALAAMLTEAGAPAEVAGDEDTVLWGKLVFLAPFALITTRYRLPLGEARVARREELTALVEELSAVGRACGLPAEAADAARVMARYDAFPDATKSSMLRDAEAGRPLELDAVGGAVVRAAERHGVPVPVLTRLVTELAAEQPRR